MSEPSKKPHPLERRPPPSSEPPPTQRPQPAGPPPRLRLAHVLLVGVIVVFLVQQVSPELTAQLMKHNDAIIQGGEYYRLLTMMFLHGDAAHLFFNAYALYVIGLTVERFFGTARFALVYFLGGLGASIASLVFTPQNAIGASGAIFALLGAEGVFFYVHQKLLGQAGRRYLTNIVVIAALNLVLGLASPLIDNAAHIGGLLGGVILAWFIGPRLELHLIRQDAFEEIDAPGMRLVDTNPLERTWPTALLFAGGLALMLFYVILSWS